MNPHLQSLGWTLLHFCWQAAAITLVYRLADVALSKTRTQTRYLLALGAMLLMLASALATLAYEETRGNPELFSPSALSIVANATVASDISTEPPPYAPMNWAGAATQPLLLQLSRFLPWLDVAWLLGVAFLSVRTIGGWRMIERVRRSALLEAPEAVRANFARLCKRLGIANQVSLRISEHVQGPLAMGMVRSLIILPASALMALSPQQLEAVLAHELEHVRRADYFWNLIQTTVETLFFFHPAVWWLGSRLRQQRELCCDDAAVRACADPLLYATALLRLEERRSQQLSLAMALDGHRSSSGLRARISRVLGEAGGEERPRELTPLPLAAISAVFLLVLLTGPHLFAGLLNTMQVEPEPTESTSAPSKISLSAPAASPVAAAAPVEPVRHTGNNGAGNDSTVETATAAAHAAGQGAGEGVGLGASGPADAEQQPAPANASAPKTDYIDGMRAAGYDVDIDKYIAMKIQGITPEYAKAMANVGFGKPSAGDLIAMKIQGVTSQYVSELHAAGLQPGSIGELISDRIFHVTPEFLAGMKAAGFDSIPPGKVIALRVQGVTPEYAKTVKQQYPNATLDELVQLRIFHIDDAFLAAAKRHGFTSLSIQKLVQLRISGLLDDSDTEAK
jgi:beta-lactamase regulating signal transducer with metallopeptidase domain